MIALQTAEIPEEGLELSGKLNPEIFDLGPDDDVRPTGPIEYDLQVSRVGDLVLAQGRVESPFTLQCVCCLEDFPLLNRIDDYIAEFDLDETGPEIDLSDRIREDLLLALPSYPHCDRGDDPDRICPMAGKFEGKSDEVEAPPGSGAWDALDKLGASGESED
jgi:uncharacterized metal-binding protein YceD (DUF177 family)